MEPKSKDRAILGAVLAAVITGVATIIAAIAGSWFEPAPPGPPSTPQVTAPVTGPEDGGADEESGNVSDDAPQKETVDGSGEAAGVDPACQDLGSHLVGVLCVTPPTSAPGESYEVWGFEFPPNTQFVLNDYESPPQGVVTDAAGEFAAAFSTDPMECKTYTISLLDEMGMPIGNVLHHQPEC